jgi:hypothetical protein
MLSVLLMNPISVTFTIHSPNALQDLSTPSHLQPLLELLVLVPLLLRLSHRMLRYAHDAAYDCQPLETIMRKDLQTYV